MKEKKRQLIVTFHTTAASVAMERACRAAGIEGRLAPVPRQLPADCGISWRAAPDARGALDHPRKQSGSGGHLRDGSMPARGGPLGRRARFVQNE